MRRDPVESSALRSIGYDSRTRTLEVEYVSGDVYRYYDVSPVHAAGLRWAESKGRYVNEEIKPRYQCDEVDP